MFTFSIANVISPTVHLTLAAYNKTKYKDQFVYCNNRVDFPKRDYKLIKLRSNKRKNKEHQTQYVNINKLKGNYNDK